MPADREPHCEWLVAIDAEAEPLTEPGITRAMGATNLANFSANEIYQIHPGRLVLEVRSIAPNSVVDINFSTGSLTNGIEFSGLALAVGPGTSANLLRLPASSANKLQFQATDAISHGTIDIAIGGRLDVDSHLRGALVTSLDVDISLSGASAVATVYEHVNYGGRAWPLASTGIYSGYAVNRNIGNDIISSIVVAPGYKLKACEHYYLRGHCKVFTGSHADLRTIGFNDRISSMKLKRAR